ncbi:ankyrin repeat-containing protein, partial [Reticulomyxa filosa]
NANANANEKMNGAKKKGETAVPPLQLLEKLLKLYPQIRKWLQSKNHDMVLSCDENATKFLNTLKASQAIFICILSELENELKGRANCRNEKIKHKGKSKSKDKDKDKDKGKEKDKNASKAKDMYTNSIQQSIGINPSLNTATTTTMNMNMNINTNTNTNTNTTTMTGKSRSKSNHEMSKSNHEMSKSNHEMYKSNHEMYKSSGTNEPMPVKKHPKISPIKTYSQNPSVMLDKNYNHSRNKLVGPTVAAPVLPPALPLPLPPPPPPPPLLSPLTSVLPVVAAMNQPEKRAKRPNSVDHPHKAQKMEQHTAAKATMTRKNSNGVLKKKKRNCTAVQI